MEWIKSRIELFEKALLYFQSSEKYFRYSDPKLMKDGLKLSCNDYPIDFAYLLDGIHFRNFDKNNVPIRKKGDDWVYSNSMITAYGLANIQLYLRTGDISLIDLAKVQAEYIYENAFKAKGQILLREYELSTKSHSGIASAMNQGQASSLFLRMYQLLEDERWLKRAKELYHSFKIPWDQEGGVSYFFEDGSIWVEEYPKAPLRHILNGALFGILALQEITEFVEELKPLNEKVLKGLTNMLPQFDRGYWSNYYVPVSSNRTYIASMKYHALHVLQLRIIGARAGLKVLTDAADLYEKYQSSWFNRSRAALHITKEKVLKQYK